jgi:hypothetical protein
VTAALFLVPAAQAAAAEFSLGVKNTGSGEGTVWCKANGSLLLEECELEYEEGTTLVLVAEPEVGSTFVKYDGGTGSATVCTGKPECAFTIEANTTIEAVFGLQEFELTVKTEGGGKGSVVCEVDAGPSEPCPAAKKYPFGTAVTLYAEPAEGSEFVKWSGDCSSVEVECELTVEEPLSVTAIFKLEPPFELTVQTGGTGAGKVECEVESEPAEECEAVAEYEEGTAITLIAEPKSGSEFVKWEGGCDSVVGNKCKVKMDADKTVKAIFTPISRTLTITEAGTGSGEVKCKFDGGSAGACTSPQPNGTAVEVIATAKAGSTFAGFSSGTGSASACSTSPCSFTIEANSAVTATFTPISRTLTITEAGTGSGEVKCKFNGGSAGACTSPQPNGTAVEIVATAKAGSTFAGFSSGTGSASACSTSPCSFTIEANSAVTATFTPISRTLTITEAGTGSGEVKCKFNGGSAGACTSPQPNGTAVEIVATAKAGSTFAGFGSGTGSASACSTSPCSFTIEANSAVTATFEPEPEKFELTIVKAGTGSGSVTCNATACAATYPEGEEVTLAANPASGSTFTGWSGGGCSGTASCEVTIEEDTTVTATFTANPKPEETCATNASLCPPPPPPAEGTAKASASATVKSGKAALKLTCTGGPCKGSLKLTAKVKQGTKTKTLVIGKASFSIASGASTTLKVKLSGPAKTELAKGKVLKAKVGGTGIAASTVKLKPPKK